MELFIKERCIELQKIKHPQTGELLISFFNKPVINNDLQSWIGGMTLDKIIEKYSSDHISKDGTDFLKDILELCQIYRNYYFDDDISRQNVDLLEVANWETFLLLRKTNNQIKYPSSQQQILHNRVFVTNGTTYNVGDWVFVNNPIDPRKPIVAQVIQIKDNYNCNFYLYPDQTVHRVDRLFFQNEVFQTKRNKICEDSEILGRCLVNFSLQNDPVNEWNIPSSDIFVCEFKYDINTCEFEKISSTESIQRQLQKFKSPLIHLLSKDAHPNMSIPESVQPDELYVPKIGGVYMRDVDSNDRIGEYSTSTYCPPWIIREKTTFQSFIEQSKIVHFKPSNISEIHISKNYDLNEEQRFYFYKKIHELSMDNSIKNSITMNEFQSSVFIDFIEWQYFHLNRKILNWEISFILQYFNYVIVDNIKNCFELWEKNKFQIEKSLINIEILQEMSHALVLGFSLLKDSSYNLNEDLIKSKIYSIGPILRNMIIKEFKNVKSDLMNIENILYDEISSQESIDEISSFIVNTDEKRRNDSMNLSEDFLPASTQDHYLVETSHETPNFTSTQINEKLDEETTIASNKEDIPIEEITSQIFNTAPESINMPPPSLPQQSKFFPQQIIEVPATQSPNRIKILNHNEMTEEDENIYHRSSVGKDNKDQQKVVTSSPPPPPLVDQSIIGHDINQEIVALKIAINEVTNYSNNTATNVGMIMDTIQDIFRRIEKERSSSNIDDLRILVESIEAKINKFDFNIEMIDRLNEKKLIFEEVLKKNLDKTESEKQKILEYVHENVVKSFQHTYRDLLEDVIRLEEDSDRIKDSLKLLNEKFDDQFMTSEQLNSVLKRITVKNTKTDERVKLLENEIKDIQGSLELVQRQIREIKEFDQTDFLSSKIDSLQSQIDSNHRKLLERIEDSNRKNAQIFLKNTSLTHQVQKLTDDKRDLFLQNQLLQEKFDKMTTIFEKRFQSLEHMIHIQQSTPFLNPPRTSEAAITAPLFPNLTQLDHNSDSFSKAKQLMPDLISSAIWKRVRLTKATNMTPNTTIKTNDTGIDMNDSESPKIEKIVQSEDDIDNDQEEKETIIVEDSESSENQEGQNKNKNKYEENSLTNDQTPVSVLNLDLEPSINSKVQETSINKDVKSEASGPENVFLSTDKKEKGEHDNDADHTSTDKTKKRQFINNENIKNKSKKSKTSSTKDGNLFVKEEL